MRRTQAIFGSASMAEAYEGLRSDYEAARTSRYRRRRTGVAAMGSGADYHYRSEADYLRMMELSRDLYRNDSVLPQGLERAAANIFQEGLLLDPQTGDKGLDTALLDRWKEWSEDPDKCHVAGELPFNAQASLAWTQSQVDGDIFVLPLREGSLQLVEAHRVRTPRNTRRNVVHGILLDDRRKRLEYWITKEDIDPDRSIAKVSDITAYAARDRDGRKQVLHIYDPKRATQTRGVTAFAPIVDMIGMHDDTQFAKLVQQQIVSCIAFFRERSEMFGGAGTAQLGEQEAEAQGDGSTRVIEHIAPGLEFRGAPGEKLSGFSPNVPNPEWFPHAQLILTFISINVGLPLQVFLLDPSKTNFSGWRGAIDQARIGFRRHQRRISQQLHRPVYEWKVRQWASEDPALRVRLTADERMVLTHSWNCPEWKYIQPEVEAKADALRIEKLLVSPRRRAAERGVDWDRLRAEIVEDNTQLLREAKQAALDLNAEFEEDPVSWREVLFVTTGIYPQSPPLKSAETEPAEDTEQEDDDGDRPEGDTADPPSRSVLRTVGR